MEKEKAERKLKLTPSECTYFKQMLEARCFDMTLVSRSVFTDKKLSDKYRDRKLTKVLNGEVYITETELKRLDSVANCIILDNQHYFHLLKCQELVQGIVAVAEEAKKFEPTYEM